MEVQIIKLSDTGQISIPKSIIDNLNLSKGDPIRIIQNEKLIILEKIDEEELKDLLSYAKEVARKASDEDDILDQIGKYFTDSL